MRDAFIGILFALMMIIMVKACVQLGALSADFHKGLKGHLLQERGK